MPSLSKKYKINYNKHYTTSKNKKQRGRKSIKVYHNRVKPMSRKRKHYMGGDIEAPAINNIFPSGQTYQPNMDCLEKECDKRDDAGEKTITCLNTQIVMNLFRQNLDTSELATSVRIDGKFTEEERKHVEDLTEKYITNYVDSLFSKSFFSKNNAELKPGNTQKLKDLLEVIKPKYVDYLIQNSTLSAEIKQKILVVQQELNVVDNTAASTATAPATAPTIVNATATAPAPATTPATAPTIVNATTPAPATAPIDNAPAPTLAPTIVNAPTNAPIDNATTPAATIVDNTAVIEAERAKKAADDAEAERLRLEAAQAKQTALNEVKQINQTRIDATNKANETYADAVNEANRIRIEAVEKANQELDKNIRDGLRQTRYNYIHNSALQKAENAEQKAIKSAEKVMNKAITDAETAEENALDANKRKILAKKNLLASNKTTNP